MADTLTTNYSFVKPEPGASEDTWGDKLNENWEDLDTLLGGVCQAEFSILDGATVTTSELNTLDGIDTAGTGFGYVPQGGIIMWSGSIAGIPTGWALCDGTNGTPNLQDRFVVGAGDSYAVVATGGADSVTPTTSSAGGHNHEGATGLHALTESQMPKHYHQMRGPNAISAPQNGGVGNGGVYGGGTADDPAYGYGTWSTGGGAASGSTSTGTGNGQGHSHTISTDGAHTHTVTVDTRPPYYALAYIMKL